MSRGSFRLAVALAPSHRAENYNYRACLALAGLSAQILEMIYHNTHYFFKKAEG